MACRILGRQSMTTKLPVPRLPGRDSHNRAYVQTTSFSSSYWRLRTLTCLVVADRTVSPARRRIEECLRPAVVQPFGDVLPAEEACQDSRTRARYSLTPPYRPPWSSHSITAVRGVTVGAHHDLVSVMVVRLARTEVIPLHARAFGAMAKSFDARLSITPRHDMCHSGRAEGEQRCYQGN